MADHPLAPFNPFGDSPQESTPNATTATFAEAIPNVFSFNTPPSVVSVQIRSQFHGPTTGSFYTTGLNAQALPELMAQGVPRHRAPLVVKNLYFLAGRMLQGIPVQAGHRSTDHDYRVSIVATGPPHTLTLIPFYPDCEEWGSFPPAPQQDRTRRNRLLAAAWFPANHDTFDEADAEYLVANVQHFQRLLQLPDLARINATLPVGLQQLVHRHISRKIMSAIPPSAAAAATTPPPTTTTTTTMQNHFLAPSPLTKRSALVQDWSNIPKKRPTIEKPRSNTMQPHPPRSHTNLIAMSSTSSFQHTTTGTSIANTTTASSRILHANDDENKKSKNGIVVAMVPPHHGESFCKENIHSSASRLNSTTSTRCTTTHNSTSSSNNNNKNKKQEILVISKNQRMK